MEDGESDPRTEGGRLGRSTLRTGNVYADNGKSSENRPSRPEVDDITVPRTSVLPYDKNGSNPRFGRSTKSRRFPPTRNDPTPPYEGLQSRSHPDPVPYRDPVRFLRETDLHPWRFFTVRTVDRPRDRHTVLDRRPRLENGPTLLR